MSKQVIDLRSDTVTKPTTSMLSAMFNAQVGDDVYGEDPTVNTLQEMAASMFNHEAALFCPSGTMTNQLAIKTHTKPGDEVICHEYAHIYNYEGGGMALNANVQARLIHSKRGVFSPTDLALKLQVDNEHFPHTSLVCVENTCNKAGGTTWTIDELTAVSDWCKSKKIPLHLDGARLFNAIVKQGYSPQEIGSLFDSISICLSKGLGAPAGSLLLGNKTFIKQAHRYRKAMGGGMRQIGYLAAAGIFALENNLNRLAEDHQLALKLHQSIADASFVAHAFTPETNLVLFQLKESISDEAFLHHLKQNGILAGTMAPGLVRFVTHLNISESDINQVITILNKLANDLA